MAVKRYLIELDETDLVVRVYIVRKGCFPEIPTCKKFQNMRQAVVDYLMPLYRKFKKKNTPPSS